MKLLQGFFVILALLAFTPVAEAQESCETKSHVTTTAKGATFMQMEYCGDADLTTVFTCTKGSNEVKIVLPISAFDPDDEPGQTFKNTFKFGKVVTERTLRTVAPVKGGAGDVGAAITLATDDPLWKALLKPDLDIVSENNNSASRVGTYSSDKENLEKFFRACGF
jgi:hypothetical protein